VSPLASELTLGLRDEIAGGMPRCGSNRLASAFIPRIGHADQKTPESRRALFRIMPPLSTPVENSPNRRSKIPQPPSGGG